MTGILNLGHLPSTLKGLNLEYNDCSGAVKLKALPPDLELLMVNGNKELEGVVRTSYLPASLTFFHRKYALWRRGAIKKCFFNMLNTQVC